MEKNLKHKDVWNGKYRGIAYEVVRWSFENPIECLTKENWNYYLYLHTSQIPKKHLLRFDMPVSNSKYLKGRLHYEYNDGVLSDLNWQGGITFYEKTIHPKGHTLIIQAGCDYQHSWNQGHTYDIESIAIDARATIDDLWEKAPYLKIWCYNCGKFFAPKKEQFLCNKCLSKRETNNEN